jgi:hypothetical protein
MISRTTFAVVIACLIAWTTASPVGNCFDGGRERYYGIEVDPPIMLAPAGDTAVGTPDYPAAIVALFDWHQDKPEGTAYYLIEQGCGEHSSVYGPLSGTVRDGKLQMTWKWKTDKTKWTMVGSEDTDTHEFTGTAKVEGARTVLFSRPSEKSSKYAPMFEAPPAVQTCTFKMIPLSRLKEKRLAFAVNREAQNEYQTFVSQHLVVGTQTGFHIIDNPQILNKSLNEFQLAAAEAEKLADQKRKLASLVVAHNNMGCCYFRLGNYSDATREFKAASEFAAQHGSSWMDNMKNQSAVVQRNLDASVKWQSMPQSGFDRPKSGAVLMLNP